MSKQAQPASAVQAKSRSKHAAKPRAATPSATSEPRRKRSAPSSTTPAAATDTNPAGAKSPSSSSKPRRVPTKPRAGGLTAAAELLAKTRKPMKCADMATALIKSGAWSPKGKTPAATLASAPCNGGLIAVNFIAGIPPHTTSETRARTGAVRANPLRRASTSHPAETTFLSGTDASRLTKALYSMRFAVGFANTARINASLSLTASSLRDLVNMRQSTADVISSLFDSTGNCVIPEFNGQSPDETLIAIATAVAPPDPDCCGLTAGNAGFMVAPRCTRPVTLGLVIGFELVSKGLIYIAGDDALPEFVPTTKLKDILEESAGIPARGSL